MYSLSKATCVIKIKRDSMNGANGMQRGEEKFVQGFGGEI